jgi:protein ImuB
MLWLCLRFSRLPLQCLTQEEDPPCAVVERQRLLCLNDAAAAAGLRAGMGTATARTLCDGQGLQLLERQPEAETESLHALCCWAYGITPTLYPWRENCLLLEIGGCLRLFGGLHSLLHRVEQDLTQRGHLPEYGLAATPKAAWLLSFAPPALALDSQRPLPERLAPLPLSLLSPLAPAVEGLGRAGLTSLGDLLALPDTAIGRRCGRATLTLMQQIRGQRLDREAAFEPPRSFRDSHTFGYEVQHLDEMQPALSRLLQALQRFLENTQQHTREICWQLADEQERQRSLRVRMGEGSTCARTWLSLSRLRLEREPALGAVARITLSSDALEAACPLGSDLFEQSHSEPLEHLTDRLRSRLGSPAVEHVGVRSEHLPERAVQRSRGAPPEGGAAAGAARPFWLFEQPEPARQAGSTTLHWKRHTLTLRRGPERIEDGWWQCPASRDYFVATTTEGQPVWVFFDRLQRRWFVHGLFA